MWQWFGWEFDLLRERCEKCVERVNGACAVLGVCTWEGGDWEAGLIIVKISLTL